VLKSQTKGPVYIAIDLKSYYASVECVERGLNPLTTNLLVADETRSDKTICLAVSPSLKAMGVPSRPRLFEAKQAIKLYEAQHHTKVEYIIAKPQMALYEKVSAKIYSIYLQYISTCDIHVYSIDEVFIEATNYMTMYAAASEVSGERPVQNHHRRCAEGRPTRADHHSPKRCQHRDHTVFGHLPDIQADRIITPALK